MFQDDLLISPPKANKSKSHCSVPLCTKSGYVVENGEKVTFHRWPLKDKDILKQWIVKCRRDIGKHFQVTQHTKICSRHFEESDFLHTPKGRRLLKKKAIPSKFDWSINKPNRLRQNVVLPSCSSTSAHEVIADDGINQTEENNTQTVSKDAEIQQLKDELKKQKEAAELFRKERDHLRKVYGQVWKKAKINRRSEFSVDCIKNSDQDICFYTGFPTYQAFSSAFKLLDVGLDGENIRWRDNKGRSRRPDNFKLSPINQFFLIMVRLRLGLFVKDLAYRFGVSTGTVNRICNTWINYMYLKLGSINIWPSQETIQETMPESVKLKYPNLEWIIDAFEIQCERPSSLLLQSKSYSNYKSRNTLKGLLACTPAGHIGFISELYTGMISDKELLLRSGFLKQQHHQGAMWMVDKGFVIQDLVEHLGVTVNMPKFLGKNLQMAAEDVVHTQEVASQRIHIERAINKVKNFHIFDSPVPLTMWGSVNQIWTVCALLTHFQNPIISA